MVAWPLGEPERDHRVVFDALRGCEERVQRDRKTENRCMAAPARLSYPCQDGQNGNPGFNRFYGMGERELNSSFAESEPQESL